MVKAAILSLVTATAIFAQSVAMAATTGTSSLIDSGTLSSAIAGKQEPAAMQAEKSALEELSVTEIKEAIDAIKSGYVDPENVSPENLDRAQLAGLIQRLAPGIAILSGSTAAARAGEAPFRNEVLDNRIGYIRLGSVDRDHLTKLDSALDDFTGKGLNSLILDLRGTPASGDFEIAAEVTRRFAPKGKVLFSLKSRDPKKDRVFTSNVDSKFTGTLVVVISTENAGSAEVIAQTLRQHAEAIVVGGRSKGRPAEFVEVPLKSGAILEMAVAEAAVQDAPSIYPEGVIPDISVTIPENVQREVLKEALKTGVGPLVFETERPRFNEAALVAGENPELDAMQAAQQAKGKEKEKPKVLRDVALQRAVDAITSIEVFRKANKGKGSR